MKRRDFIEKVAVGTAGVVGISTLNDGLLTAKPSRKSYRDVRTKSNFDFDWRFHLGDVPAAKEASFNDNSWRKLNVPHDWSIEGKFSKDNPAGVGGGALPGGIGWYRKTFTIPESDKEKLIFIDFDGVYQDSEVWINGHFLGKRPYGYSSFRYELTQYLKYGKTPNVISVRADNSLQPNSRWYSGSGIYRNVWLVMTNRVYVDHWGTYVTTPLVSEESAATTMQTKVKNSLDQAQDVTLRTFFYDSTGKKVAEKSSDKTIAANSVEEYTHNVVIMNPSLWSIEFPYLYKVVSQVESKGQILDRYETPFGIRYFYFDVDNGFYLNGKHVKILGTCDHHNDLGILGSALNETALRRRLQILKDMGCNGIRTSHNPPAPELLNMADQMGFIIMDEAFDCWDLGKVKYDYHIHWKKWHKRDLEDMLRRDRNHPSIFLWSIGNEIPEQLHPHGSKIALELAKIVKSMDTTRPITSACNHPDPNNYIIKSGALDVIGLNYHSEEYPDFPKMFAGKKLIATETTSALVSRGCYDMPSNSIRRWPDRRHPDSMNANYTCSSYDNCCAPWGATHEEGWRRIKESDAVSGMFIWTGFDYLGEPTPYGWPARSSYFGISDLCTFPKDVFYMYQSQWTNKPVLHLFPHWNWKEDEIIDVWTYTNCDEVELFLNGKSQGTKYLTGDEMHLWWRLTFTPGTLKAVGKHNGKVILTKEIHTAGAPSKIMLIPDKQRISADGQDLSYVTVKIVDSKGNMVPNAGNLVHFDISGKAFIASVGNGDETDHDPFKSNYRKAYNGMCLAILQSSGGRGSISLRASSDGLKPATLQLYAI